MCEVVVPVIKAGKKVGVTIGTERIMFDEMEPSMRA